MAPASDAGSGRTRDPTAGRRMQSASVPKTPGMARETPVSLLIPAGYRCPRGRGPDSDIQARHRNIHPEGGGDHPPAWIPDPLHRIYQPLGFQIRPWGDQFRLGSICRRARGQSHVYLPPALSVRQRVISRWPDSRLQDFGTPGFVHLVIPTCTFHVVIRLRLAQHRPPEPWCPPEIAALNRPGVRQLCY